MTYAQFGTIQAADFNALAGGDPVTTSGTLNAVWATGGSDKGYGQTALANVAVGQTVAAVGQWVTLVANTASAATHQGTSITSVTAPAAGGAITYLSAIPTNLTTIYTSRLNAASQGGAVSNTATAGSSWSNIATFTHTVTFANGDAARYFFNSGGQIKVQCAHPAGTGINLLFNNLASNVGTVTLSAPTSGTITVGGVSYNGVTKIGGGGTAPNVYLTNNGYYALTTSNATVFNQQASTGPANYNPNSKIYMNFKSNGTVGTHSDAGSVLTLYTVWDEIPDGLVVSTGSAVTVSAQVPESTNIANAWGTVSVTGTVAVV